MFQKEYRLVLMGSKRFKGKPCIFCWSAESTTTGDHLFARAFVSKDNRHDLIKVPCCKACNDQKSKLEHYLTAVMPIGGRHVDALEAIELVPNRIRRNAKLRRNLAAQSEYLSRPDNTRAFAIPFEATDLLKYSKWLIKGLAFYHWEIRLEPGFDTVRCEQLTPEGDFLLLDGLPNSFEKIDGSLGLGALDYSGYKTSSSVGTVTMWRIVFLGGFLTTDKEGNDSNVIWGIAGDTKMASLFSEVFSPKF